MGMCKFVELNNACLINEARMDIQVKGSSLQSVRFKRENLVAEFLRKSTVEVSDWQKETKQLLVIQINIFQLILKRYL